MSFSILGTGIYLVDIILTSDLSDPLIPPVRYVRFKCLLAMLSIRGGIYTQSNAYNSTSAIIHGGMGKYKLTGIVWHQITPLTVTEHLQVTTIPAGPPGRKFEMRAIH